MSDALKQLSEGLADEDPSVREESAQALAQLEDPKAANLLVRALSDENETVRMWGAYGLGMLRQQSHVQALRKASTADASNLVRLWAAFAVANQGDKDATTLLLSFLDHDSLDVRNNAADAVLNLRTHELVRPALRTRMASSNDRVRAWASGILHRMGDPTALEVWRQTLVNPQSRLDAAMVAPHLKEESAGRDLLRVLAELTEEQLDLTHTQVGDLSTSEVLSIPLLDLGLDAMCAQANKDDALRADLLTFLARNTAADPDVVDQVQSFFIHRPVEHTGQDLANLIEEQGEEDQALFLARAAEVVPDAVMPALNRLGEATRTQLLAAVAKAASADPEQIYTYVPLIELVKPSPYGTPFANLTLPEDGGELDTLTGLDDDEVSVLDEGGDLTSDDEEEDDEMNVLIQRMVDGERLSAEQKDRVETFLTELGMSAEEYLADQAQLQEEDEGDELPPDGPEVAQRSLLFAALVQRVLIEQELASKKISVQAADAQLKKLKGWVGEHGLADLFVEEERELFEMGVGQWSDEDREVYELTSEPLAISLWALGKAPLPAVDAPARGRELLKLLPLFQDPADFIQRGSLRDGEELDAEREKIEMFCWRAEQEDIARQAAAGEALDLDEDEVIAEAKEHGFEATATEKKLGRPAMIAEAFRHIARVTAGRLKEEGMLTALVGGDFAFGGKAFKDLSDDELLAALNLLQERQKTLQWLCFGDAVEDAEDEGFDEAGDLDDEELDDDELEEELDDEDESGEKV